MSKEKKPRKPRKKTPVPGAPITAGGDDRPSDPALADRPSDPVVGDRPVDVSIPVAATEVETKPVVAKPMPLDGTQPVETSAILVSATPAEQTASPTTEPAAPSIETNPEPAATIETKPEPEAKSPEPTPEPAKPTEPTPEPEAKPALSVVPALLEVPALSSPVSSLVETKLDPAAPSAPDPAAPSVPAADSPVRVDLREGARRTGDDRRRSEDRPEAADELPTGAEARAKIDDATLKSTATDTKAATDDATPDRTSVAGKSVDDNKSVASNEAAGELGERRSGISDRRASDEPKVATPVGEAVRYADPDAASLPAPDPIAHPAAGTMLVPGQAALEAARIAGEIVGDISTASGAAIVAAAAAGAAIEAARARQAAGIEDGTSPQAAGAAAAAAVAAAATSASNDPPPASDGQAGDPTTTVRMQRERILRALADDLAVNPALTDPLTASQANAPLSRAGSHGGDPVAMEAREEGVLDPVQIAAQAIQRLRHRASNDFAELRGHYHRHDLVVLLAALLIIVVAGAIHGGMVTPPTVKFPQHEQDQEAIARGLTFEHSQSWLKVEKLPPWPPRIARDPTGMPPKSNGAYYAALTSSLDPNARIEVFIDKRPAWTNIVTGLELDRRTRWGELYTLDGSSIEEIEDQNWLRTAYRYAHAAEKGDVPRVDRAVEYATVDREQIYVVTLFGSAGELSKIEQLVAPTLRVPQKPGARSALPLVPQTRSTAHRNLPDPVSRTFDSTVMIVVADLIDGKLQARGGGSGVIVGADGSILTNYHVIHDKNGRLHDVFVVGRFGHLDEAPQLQCAGRPNRSKLQRELDLALVKCDTDLDGRIWTPGSFGIWQTLPEAKQSDVRVGQRVWVLGFPDVGGGGLTLSTGEISGWTGQDGAAGRDFIKTDASITHGNSGGPVVDDLGKLIGIATASRTRISPNGTVIETKQVGLVRPLAAASDLMTIAAIGWTPREGHTDVEIQPSAVEASPEGIRIATHVIDHASEAPVRDALVMVLRPEVNASDVDVNRLDDQVISWGRSNTQGEVQLKQPVPLGTYTVLVRASGYEPLIGDGKLRLDDKSPPAFDPWGGIRLLRR